MMDTHEPIYTEEKENDENDPPRIRRLKEYAKDHNARLIGFNFNPRNPDNVQARLQFNSQDNYIAYLSTFPPYPQDNCVRPWQEKEGSNNIFILGAELTAGTVSTSVGDSSFKGEATSFNLNLAQTASQQGSQSQFHQQPSGYPGGAVASSSHQFWGGGGAFSTSCSITATTSCFYDAAWICPTRCPTRSATTSTYVFF